MIFFYVGLLIPVIIVLGARAYFSEYKTSFKDMLSAFIAGVITLVSAVVAVIRPSEMPTWIFGAGVGSIVIIITMVAKMSFFPAKDDDDRLDRP